MKITYIHHSSFCVRHQGKVFLFDYFLGELPEFEEEDDIFVFASHKHPDHFSLDIFQLAKKYKNVTFFLGCDIKLNENYLKRKGIDPALREKMVFTKKHTTLEYHDVEIEVLDSTDAGAAFLVSYAGKTIYHAGDLNWWSWNGEMAVKNRQMGEKYCHEIDLLKGKHIDAAFVPVDPRLEDKYALGIDYFMKTTITEHVFPMHFWREYDCVERLCKRQESEQYKNKIMVIHDENESWEL